MPNKILPGLLSYMLSFRWQGMCPEAINPLKQGNKSISNRSLSTGVLSSVVLMSQRSCHLESFSAQ